MFKKPEEDMGKDRNTIHEQNESQKVILELKHMKTYEQDKKAKEKSNTTKTCFCEKTEKIDKCLAKWTKKEKKFQITKTRS